MFIDETCKCEIIWKFMQVMVNATEKNETEGFIVRVNWVNHGKSWILSAAAVFQRLIRMSIVRAKPSLKDCGECGRGAPRWEARVALLKWILRHSTLSTTVYALLSPILPELKKHLCILIIPYIFTFFLCVCGKGQRNSTSYFETADWCSKNTECCEMVCRLCNSKWCLTLW